MIYLLYIIWLLLPGAYLLMLLWGWLESKGKKEKRNDLKDMLHQAIFLSVCVSVAFVIDLYFLDDFYRSVVPGFLPKGLLQVLLLPALLVIGAQVVGGSEPIRVKRGGSKGSGQKRRR